MHHAVLQEQLEEAQRSPLLDEDEGQGQYPELASRIDEEEEGQDPELADASVAENAG